MLKFEVVTPQKKALETEVDSVTLPGSEGELGILPDHIPLLTTLDTGIVSTPTDLKTNPSGSLGLRSG